MLALDEFENQILLPSRDELRDNPTSFLRAFTAIWAVDSFASHISYHNSSLDPCRSETEEQFKNRIEDLNKIEAAKFRILRSASNATKHAKRHEKDGRFVVARSNALTVGNSAGMFGFLQRSYLWGEQIYVELDVVLDPESRKLIDNLAQRKRRDIRYDYGNFFGASVPVFDLVFDSIELLREHILQEPK